MIINKKTLVITGFIYIIATIMCGNHLFILPTIITIGAVTCRILSTLNIIKPITRRFVRIFAISGLATLVLSAFISRNIADSFINLLILGCALKFLEYFNKRDTYVQCSALMFLTILPLVFHYQIYIVFYLLVIPIMLLWSFTALTHMQSIKDDLKTILKIIIPAIPLTIVFFITFPRFGSIWVIPDNNIVSSGISDTISLNSVEKLLQSDKIIGRVLFKGDIPKKELRYFRAITYSDFNGKEWRENSTLQNDRNRTRYRNYFNDLPEQPELSNIETSYDLMLEPSNTKYVPTLRYSNSSDKNVFYISDDNFTVANPISSRIMIRLDYSRQTHDDYNPVENELNRYLHYSKKHNIKTQNLVKELTNNIVSDEDKVFALLKYFHENNFIYSLNSGVYNNNDSIDEFLFQRKKGFCAHFSQSLAIMLRMAKIPSRIVGGYYGGTEKPQDNYLILRESDAHAWVEAYLNGNWVPYDPTSLISHNDNSIVNNINNQQYNILYSNSVWGNFYHKVTNITEYLDLHWSMFVLNFDSNIQSDLFSNSISRIFYIIGAGIALYIAFIFITNMKRRKEKQKPEMIILQYILIKLQLKGFAIQKNETLRAFIKRLEETNLEINANPDTVATSAITLSKTTEAKTTKAAEEENTKVDKTKKIKDKKLPTNVLQHFKEFVILFEKIHYQNIDSKEYKKLIKELKRRAITMFFK